MLDEDADGIERLCEQRAAVVQLERGDSVGHLQKDVSGRVEACVFEATLGFVYRRGVNQVVLLP